MDILAKIRQQIKTRKRCQNCPLHDKGNVISSGPKDCDILFIGLNPGKDELEQDAPFVGKAGQILRKGIEQAKLEDLKIAFTNSILCSTPNEAEIPSVSVCVASCKNLVHKIIEYYNPKVIGSLGHGTTTYLFKIANNLTEIHGQVFKTIINKKYTVVPLVHPSALRFGIITRDEFIKDLKKLKTIIRGKNERT